MTIETYDKASAGYNVVLGVGAGIAAYKSADLVRRLRELGHDVRVVMTARAAEFVGPATFQALSGNPVRQSLWDEQAEAAMGHIELARWAQILLIAPATADLMARLAHGVADDLLTTLALATNAPLLLAPAMNHAMWSHAATQANAALLRERGAQLIGPDSGSQACGDTGAGRMAEPVAIAAAVSKCSVTSAPAVTGAHDASLCDRHVMVTAGPTFEDIDPVRFIGNRSSGRMGFALARAARAAGARVTLIAGPVVLDTPAAVERINVRSAAELRTAVLSRLPGVEVFIANAAVADFRPALRAEHKIKKDSAIRSLELVPTPDVLAEVAAHAERPALVVGFAAETGSLREHALSKLQRKNLDLVIANPVGHPDSGFEVDRNEALALWVGGERLFAPMGKAALATQLMALIAERLAAMNGPGA